MKASLLLSTYKMPRHLKLVLTGLQRQTCQDFEILLCDDGSGEETRSIAQAFKSHSKISLTHFWQEDMGFRKCKILNEAIRNSKGGILIFLDGDCIPERHFVEDHVQQSRKGYFLAGRRVELGPEFSSTLTPDLIKAGALERLYPPFIRSFFKKDSQHFNRIFRITNPLLRSLLKMKKIDDMKGCNFSVYREDLFSINGFDEAYEGYGREDTDVEWRLTHLGLKIKSLKGLALQYHVWHERRGFTPVNDALLEEVKKTKRIRCKKGLVHE